VRDTDTRLALLAYLDARIPPAAAPTLRSLGRQHEQDRTRLLRKVIKRFERFDMARVLGEIAAGRTCARRPWASIAGGWQDQLRRTVIERAGAARESVHHATGVYFPKRLHAARIAVKKLRYAMEIASATGAGLVTNDSMRHLRRTQDVLGDLHDRQVLIDDLPKNATPGQVIDSDHIALVVQILEAECRDLHAQFLKRRPQVLEICHRLVRAHPQRGVAITPAAAALVISSALYLWRRTRASEPALRERGVTVRIPIPDAAAAGR
jgi:CHAD domain-containing protein